MKAIDSAIVTIIKKPFILIFWGVLMLILIMFEYLMPVFKMLHQLSAVSGSNSFESIMSFIQVLYGYLNNGKTVLTAVVICVIILAALSVLISVLLSGYFYILNNAVYKRQQQKVLFSKGVKKYFRTVWLITFTVLFLGLLLLIVMAVSSFPALVITRATIAMDEGKEMLSAALFVDVLTCIVLFFGSMFFKIYTVFLYPAAVNNGNSVKNVFSKAKKFADENFWKVFCSLLIFDLVFIGFQILFINFVGSGWVFLLKWIFLTLFFALFTTYIFATYKRYSEKIY